MDQPQLVSQGYCHAYFYFMIEYIFGLVSLFNGISTFAGYLMPKLFS